MASLFISHRGSDKAKAIKLSEQLQRAGHDVWLDEWKIDIGDSIIQNINEGLRKCEFLILCYSKAGVEAPWISREWMSALASQLSGVNIRLLPVMLSGGEPPSILRDVRYADLTSRWDKGVEAI